MTKEEFWNKKKTLLFKDARSHRAFELGVRFSESRITELENENAQAKEIISKLLTRLHKLTYTGLNCEECKQAEQFIKEIENDKDR